MTGKRYVTKQELNSIAKTETVMKSTRKSLKNLKLHGLPYTPEFDKFVDRHVGAWTEPFITDKPHPYTQQSVKLLVNPGQEEEFEKRMIHMGFSRSCGSFKGWKKSQWVAIKHADEMYSQLCDEDGKYHERYNLPVITFKQFINGYVPKTAKFKKDRYYRHTNHGGVIKCTDPLGDSSFLKGVLVERGSCTHPLGHETNDWAKKFLVHLPGYKETFKEGDWVQIVLNNSIYDGEVFQIDKIYDRDPGVSDIGRRVKLKGLANHSYKFEWLKHIENPNPEILFDKHKIEVNYNHALKDHVYKVGCFGPVRGEDIRKFMEVGRAIHKSGEDLDKVFNFIEKHWNQLKL